MNAAPTCAGKVDRVQPMKLTDQSRFLDAEGNLNLFNRFKGMLEFGSDWYPRMQAQASVVHRMSKILGNHHSLLRNVPIPGVEARQTTLILISPQGIRVLMVHPTRGVFRAQDEKWLKYDSNARAFEPAEPNLQVEALQVAARVERLLKAQDLPVLGVEAVMLFTNPRTLVDGQRPQARLVAADAIDYFAANLDRTPPVMNKSDVRTFTEAILKPRFPAPRSVDEFITGRPIDTEKRRRARKVSTAKPMHGTQESASRTTAIKEPAHSVQRTPAVTPAFDLSLDPLDQLETQSDEWAWLRNLQDPEKDPGQTAGIKRPPHRAHPRVAPVGSGPGHRR